MEEMALRSKLCVLHCYFRGFVKAANDVGGRDSSSGTTSDFKIAGEEPNASHSHEEISSPLSAQILEFCNPELFPETLQNSEVASSSNCCYEEHSSYTTNILSFVPDINNFTSTINNNGNINTIAATSTTSTTAPTTNTPNSNRNLSIIFDSPEEIENDISASIDFSPSPPFSVPPFLAPQQDQFDLSSLQSQVPETDVINGLSQYPSEPVVPLVGPPLPSVYEEEALSSMPSYMRMNPSSPSCSFLDQTIGPYLPGNLNAALFAENSGIFNGSMLVGKELQPQELEYQGDNGIFCPEPLPRIFNSNELQALSNESQHLRKEKIHRYMKKRNERNFSKKIKYACRKTLADSRPRVRGRFAKNDEFGETTRTTCSNHEEDTDEDVVVKEEDDISSDIFAHISAISHKKLKKSLLCLVGWSGFWFFGPNSSGYLLALDERYRVQCHDKMENTIFNLEKDGQKKEDSLQSLGKDVELADDNSMSKSLVEKVNPECVLILNGKESRARESCIQESSLHGILSLDNRIPKYILSFDESYLRHCLELIYISASKATSINISTNLGSSKTVVLSNGSSSPRISSRYACDLAKFIIECPLVAGIGNAVINYAGDWCVGRITGSKSMMNILKSPLFHQFGALDSDINFGRTNLISNKGASCSDFMSSPSGLSISSSQKLEKETVLGNHGYGLGPVHRRLVSISSTNSTLSDQSSSSGSATIMQGMLQCTWKAGFPHYVFSVDDQKEAYVANLFKAESPDDKVFDYLYMFHLRAVGKKEHDICENESDLVGKMRVSTSFKLCPNNSEIMETEFVLFGSNDNFVGGEKKTSSHILRKNKGLSKKVMEVFKSSHSNKQRRTSKFGGTSSILDNSSRAQSQDLSNNLDPQIRATFSENHLLPNLELAAIIVKDHIRDNLQEAEIGGWGLKFLKKVGLKQTNASLETLVPSKCCLRNTGDCGTSMDILIPAGFHGGPRTRNGGPSSLTERWRSGGHCDCGGWDIGCPLTILNTRPSKKKVATPSEIQGDCKSFDLFIQGSEQGTAIMKMVNIHHGLYFIHFQSTLSALQSFSIAVAIIHTQNPTLRPKLYRCLK
ncbi:hypothetical protein F0562_035325 [Nyssa sinensis]|uniref:CCT domain-containing protein n=1 Tax=Nyssa sinensis TaxID=561372 RepID=A0A5J5ADG5_9ASTE|nr:hypothetical protein F0562_035325 [Nyssa sinensis]